MTPQPLADSIIDMSDERIAFSVDLQGAYTREDYDKAFSIYLKPIIETALGNDMVPEDMLKAKDYPFTLKGYESLITDLRILCQQYDIPFAFIERGQLPDDAPQILFVLAERYYDFHSIFRSAHKQLSNETNKL